MNSIAIYAGSTVVYWSGIIIALGAAACFALSYALYISYVGSGKALIALFPLAAVFSVLFCRLIHWYCHMEQYAGFFNAVTDYSSGGYCLPGAVLGVLLAAYIVGRLGFTANVPRLLDAVAPGAALCVAFIRLSALFDSSCRGKFTVETPVLQRLPLASPIYANGATEYRFATFFVEFLVMLLIMVVLLRFYYSRRSAPMRGGASSDGHTARLFLLLFCAAELILDSTRYDSSFMHFNGFVSIVQIFDAVAIFVLLVYYTRLSVRMNGRGGKHIALWVCWFVSLLCVGLSEYFVQRHGDWYIRCYLAMSVGIAGLIFSVYRMYRGCCDID